MVTVELVQFLMAYKARQATAVGSNPNTAVVRLLYQKQIAMALERAVKGGAATSHAKEMRDKLAKNTAEAEKLVARLRTAERDEQVPLLDRLSELKKENVALVEQLERLDEYLGGDGLFGRVMMEGLGERP